MQKLLEDDSLYVGCMLKVLSSRLVGEFCNYIILLAGHFIF